MKRKRKRHNANFRLHHDQTYLIHDLLEHLSSCPKNDYLRDHAFSKFVSSDTAPRMVRRTRAINKWLATEKNNEATNVRLLTVDPEYNILPRVTYSAFMRKVVDITTGILGEVPPDVSDLGRFSGGASTSRLRTSAHPSMKFTGGAHVTSHCREMGEALIGDSSQDLWVRLRGSNELTTVLGNVLFVVPKNSDIDRCACKEPDINMYLQLGAGRFIRSALKAEGINLNDQQVNNDLAREGSITGDLATIDLSSASDSITREFVFQSIPIFWFTLLNSLRCQRTVLDDSTEHVNEMFSSMGNGFTFELESLLFYAVAKAVAYWTRTPGRISVYGDDLIIPTQMAHDLIFVLQFLGFGVNEEKSFLEGPIRESCGGHYYCGSTITPFYVRRPITSLIDCIHVANQLRLWSRTTSGVLDEETQATWLALSSMVPKRFWGGHDHGNPYRLVSVWQPDEPHALVPNRTVHDTSVGGYLHFHDSRKTSTGIPGDPHIEDPNPHGAGFDLWQTTHKRFRARVTRHGPGDNWSYPIEIYSDAWSFDPETPAVTR